MAQKFFAPWSVRHDPEIFCWSLTILMSRSAWLLPLCRYRHNANNRGEADHRRFKARFRPMRGLERDRTARVVIRGHAVNQNLGRGDYELGVDARPGLTVAAAFDELALVVQRASFTEAGQPAADGPSTQQCMPDSAQAGRRCGSRRTSGPVDRCLYLLHHASVPDVEDRRRH